MPSTTIFDKTEVFDESIAPKIEEIIQICNREHIPIFISACVKNTEESSEYKTDMFASASNNIHLKNDLIPRFVNVTNGFTTIPPTDIIDIDFD